MSLAQSTGLALILLAAAAHAPVASTGQTLQHKAAPATATAPDRHFNRADEAFAARVAAERHGGARL